MKKSFFVVFTLVLVLIVLGFVWVTKPYMVYQYERTDSQPITLNTEYLNAVGDPLCTKLYFKVTDNEYRAIFPRFPSDLEDLHNNELIEFGEVVQLTGYRSEWVAKNKITGSESRRDVGQIDVISWSSVSAGEHQTTEADLSPQRFSGENYTSCLWDVE